MDSKGGDNELKSIILPVGTVDQQLIYVEYESSSPFVVSLKSDTGVHGSVEVEHPELTTDLVHFDNETVIAAVEEISDGEQKHEIESMIEVINNADVEFPDGEKHSNRVQKGRRKRRWSYEWQNFCSGSDNIYEHSADNSVNINTTNTLHRKPKKRLFAHR